MGVGDNTFFIFLTSLVTNKFVLLQKVWYEVHEKVGRLLKAYLYSDQANLVFFL